MSTPEFRALAQLRGVVAGVADRLENILTTLRLALDETDPPRVLGQDPEEGGQS